VPIRDPEKRKLYHREWARRYREERSSEEKERSLSLRRKSRAKRIKEGRGRDRMWFDPEYRKRQNRNARKRDYGDYADALEIFMQLEKEMQTNPIFEELPDVRAEKNRRRNGTRKEKGKRTHTDRRGELNYVDKTRWPGKTDGAGVEGGTVADAQRSERGNDGTASGASGRAVLTGDPLNHKSRNDLG